ncbi:MAG: hypothetical protein HQM14_20040 [SAR324 cluster bacterium]|nr:hypothetical protein [SAR324 cluster bacterium]
MFFLILCMTLGIGANADPAHTIMTQESPAQNIKTQQANVARFIQKKLYGRIQFSKDYSALSINTAKSGTFRIRLFDLNVDQLILAPNAQLKLSCKKQRPLCFQPVGFEGSSTSYRTQLTLNIEDVSDVNRLKKAFQDLIKLLKDAEKQQFGY